MVPLTELWLPILGSAVLVFVVSSIIHMVLPYHRSDYQKVPDEDRLMEELGRSALAPGQYTIPHAGSASAMSSPEFVEKMTRGPVAMITVLPSGPPAMGKNLALWFLYSVLIGIVAAYVAGRALGPGADYLDVFRFVGTTAFAGYSLALLQGSIWFGRPWSITFKSVFDGLVYALLTAGVFGWLW